MASNTRITETQIKACEAILEQMKLAGLTADQLFCVFEAQQLRANTGEAKDPLGLLEAVQEANDPDMSYSDHHAAIIRDVLLVQNGEA